MSRALKIGRSGRVEPAVVTLLTEAQGAVGLTLE